MPLRLVDPTRWFEADSPASERERALLQSARSERPPDRLKAAIWLWLMRRLRMRIAASRKTPPDP